MKKAALTVGWIGLMAWGALAASPTVVFLELDEESAVRVYQRAARKPSAAPAVRA